jgi:hypothetical protein
VSSFFPGVRPVELIPGDPVELRWLAGRLGVLADGLGQTAHDLTAIDAHDWTGPAADAFRQAVKVQPGRYTNAATGFSAASSGVLGYANALESAQQDASRAITTHQDAENATAAWQQRQQAATQASAEAARAHPGHAAGAPLAQPSSDPGDSGRAQAAATLLDARLALDLAAARLRATLIDAQHAAPTGTGHSAALLRRAELERYGFAVAGGVSKGADIFESFFAASKPVLVSGYSRGSTWVKPYQRSVAGHAGRVAKLKIATYTLIGLTAAAQQASADAGNDRYPLGEKILRAGTAGGIAVAGAKVTTYTATTIVSSEVVAGLLPEAIAVGSIPVVGEVVAVVVVGLAVGYVIDTYGMPLARKGALRAEHWAYHQGAHDVAKLANEEAQGYVDDAHAVVKGGQELGKAAVAVGDGTARVGGDVVHGLGKARDETVTGLRNGFHAATGWL